MKYWAKNKKGFAEGSHAVGHRALFSKLLCFLLSFVLFFSVFPTTAFAKVNTVSEATVHYYTGGASSTTLKNEMPFTVQNSNVLQNNVDRIFVVQSNSIELDDDDSITVKILLADNGSSRYRDFENITFSVYSYYGKTAKQCTFTEYELDGSIGSNKYIYNRGNSEATITYDRTSSTLTYSTTVSDVGDSCYIQLYLENPYVNTSDSETFRFRLSSFSIDVETSDTGFKNKISEFFGNLFERLTQWFNDLFQWLKDIRDGNISFAESVKTLFSNITDNIRNFFNELGTKLSDGFNNLIDNLKTAFENIGDWFTDLWNNIHDFFRELWNDFAEAVNNIAAGVVEWWEGIVEFFHSLFVPEDGYFDKYKQDWETWAREHFALFYDVMDIVDNIFDMFVTGFSESSSLVITIPEMELPVLNHPVFIEKTTFDLGEFINSHNTFKYLYNIYRIAFSGACYFLLLKFLQKTLSEVIAGDGDTL